MATDGKIYRPMSATWMRIKYHFIIIITLGLRTVRCSVPSGKVNNYFLINRSGGKFWQVITLRRRRKKKVIHFQWDTFIAPLFIYFFFYIKCIKVSAVFVMNSSDWIAIQEVFNNNRITLPIFENSFFDGFIFQKIKFRIQIQLVILNDCFRLGHRIFFNNFRFCNSCKVGR